MVLQATSEFVRYKPGLDRAQTAVLWFGPGVLSGWLG